MSKAYQPIVVEETEHIIQGLIESEFFSDYEITDYTFARQYILDLLTQKFIDGLLEDEEIELFTEDEFTKILQEIVAGTLLYDLKEKGLINSYEDDSTEETFFLTEEGRKLLKDGDKLL
jgi:DNA-binding PadR family transcriptional regulator